MEISKIEGFIRKQKVDKPIDLVGLRWYFYPNMIKGGAK